MRDLNTLLGSMRMAEAEKTASVHRAGGGAPGEEGGGARRLREQGGHDSHNLDQAHYALDDHDVMNL